MARLRNWVDGCSIALADGIAATGAVALAAVLVLWLGGCAQLGQFAASDAQSATALATAVGDNAGSSCWPVLEKTGNAVAAAGTSAGLLTAIEEKRAVQMALQDAGCQPVWTAVLAELLKATPASPFVP